MPCFRQVFAQALARARAWYDHHRGTLDRWFPWVFAVVLFAGNFSVSWLRYHTLRAGFDVAYFKQAVWMISEGRDPFLSVRGVHLLADHAYYLLYPIAFLSRLIPTVPLLLGLQAAGLAVAVVPLYRICRRLAGLSTAVSCAVLVFYALYPALQNVNEFEFHPETVLVPSAVFGAVLFGWTGRWAPYWVCVGLVLVSREDLVVVVAGLGFLHLLPGRRRVAATTVAVAVIWGAANAFVISRFPGAAAIQASRLVPYGETWPEALRFIAAHPTAVWHQLATQLDVDVVVGLLGPVLFLPLLAPRWLVPAVPLQLLYLATAQAPAQTIRHQYALVASLFVFVATAMGLSRLGADGLQRRVLVPMAAAAVVFSLQLSSVSYLQRPWEWRHRDALDRARLAAARLLPDDVPVSTSASILPLVSDREFVYAFPAPWEFYPRDIHPPDPLHWTKRTAHVRYLAIDSTALAEQRHDAGRDVLERLRGGDFHLVWEAQGVAVYQRSP